MKILSPPERGPIAQQVRVRQPLCLPRADARRAVLARCPAAGSTRSAFHDARKRSVLLVCRLENCASSSDLCSRSLSCQRSSDKNCMPQCMGSNENDTVTRPGGKHTLTWCVCARNIVSAPNDNETRATRRVLAVLLDQCHDVKPRRHHILVRRHRGANARQEVCGH